MRRPAGTADRTRGKRPHKNVARHSPAPVFAHLTPFSKQASDDDPFSSLATRVFTYAPCAIWYLTFMDIVVITTIIASLFLVIGVSEPLAARLRLPYTVILALVGILIGVGALFFLRTDLTDVLNPVAEAILALPIKSDVFLYVFLPTLLFQATLGMNLRRMIDDWVPILTLAVVAVVVATLSVGVRACLCQRIAPDGLPAGRCHRINDRPFCGRVDLSFHLCTAPPVAYH